MSPRASAIWLYTRVLRHAGALVVILAIVAGVSCGGAVTAVDDLTPAVAEVVVVPNSSTIVVGDVLPLQASVRDAEGAAISGAAIVWSVENTSIAIVSSDGIVTARSIGTTQVAASAHGKSGVASITVQRAPVASVGVQPSSASLVAGQSATLTATVKDANGAVVTDRQIAWSTSDAAVAGVDEDGVVTAHAAGTATISATSEGSSGSAVVTVTAIPVVSVSLEPQAASLHRYETVTLSPTVKDADGTTLTGRLVTWSSGDTRIADVSPTGLVTAVALGSTTIVATSEGRSASASITVIPGPLTEVRISPSSASVKSDKSVQLAATALDANGDVIAGASFVWRSSDNEIATVTSSGLVRGQRSGTVTITATWQDKTGSSTIRVTH